VASGFGISGFFPDRSYSEDHLLLSVVSPRGLAPYIVEHLIPVTLFVLIGTILAPSRGRKVVVLLGVLGGVFGWPFGPQYFLAGGSVFYAAAASGTLLGCAIGLPLSFQWQTKRRKAGEPTRQTEPNQTRLQT
jgi:hypothetical protein